MRRLSSRIATFLPFALFLIFLVYNAIGPLLANPNRAEELDGYEGIPVEIVVVIAFGATLLLGGIGLITWYTVHDDRWRRDAGAPPETVRR